MKSHHVPTTTYGWIITAEHERHVAIRPWLSMNSQPVQATPFDRLPMALEHCADGAPIQLTLN